MSNLKRIREAAGITQKELSDRSGVSIRIIQYYEQGYKDINKAQGITLYKIADAIGCSIGQLLELEEGAYMSPEEKLIQAIKNGLIEKHGADFLKLSEKAQFELILQTMRDYVDSIKTKKEVEE